MSIWALERENEIEFLKILCIISAIMNTGRSLAAVLSGSGDMSPGGDNLSKVIDALQEMMLPKRKEDLEHKVKKYRGIMEEEYSKGMLQVHAIGTSTPKNRKKRFSKVK